MQVKQR